VLVTTDDGYTFRHALIREAVHEDLLPGEHSGVHTRFARAIEADPALVGGGRADIEKAHHWYSAHNTTGALTSAWQASAQASRAVAHAERLMLLERVLELWDQVPDAAERIGADHVRVLEEAAEVARDAGEHQRGLAFTEVALAQLDAAVDPARVALLLSQRHTFRRDLGQPVDAADLDRALSLVPPDASHPARTALLLGAVHYGCHEGGAPYRGWAEEALRLARAAGDRASEAQALVALAVLEAGPLGLAGPGSEALRLLAEARQIAEEVGAYQPVIKLVVYESHLLCGAGEYERAAMVAQLGIADAERHGLARTRGAFLAINLAEPLLYLGRWDEAMEVVERALDLAPPSLTRVGLWIMSGWIALARGDTATAARRAAASRAVLAGVTYDDQEHLPQAVLDIELALATDGPAAAVAVAAEALQRYEVSGSSPRYVWPLLVSAVAVAVAAVAAREAADAADALLGTLRLVAAGQSNRDIATALFISPKTASVHVSNILGKLGAATRTEAAATAHARGLFTPAPDRPAAAG
jgi:DNA-binding NarL/FixJ family response regulator